MSESTHCFNRQVDSFGIQLFGLYQPSGATECIVCTFEGRSLEKASLGGIELEALDFNGCSRRSDRCQSVIAIPVAEDAVHPH